MEKEFVPKKTITVQLTLDMWKRFDGICIALGLPKTKAFERMIENMEEKIENAVFTEQCVR